MHGAAGVGGDDVSVGALCRCVGMTRQNYYKGRTARERSWVDETLVVELIRAERCRHRRMGGRKLLFLLRGDLKTAGVEIGRDRFFALLAKHDLLVERRRNGARTTRSWHGFGVFPNLAKDLALTAPHQLWVSDITYVRTLQGFVYLALVTDAYSRAVVGYDSSDSLEMEGALRALSMAQRQLPEGCRPVHHSDRGSQYCCGEYVALLRSHQLGISMTEENHCYENAMAERLNGILKQEYGLGDTFGRKADVPAAAAEGVGLYNHARPHEALGYRFPMAVHMGKASVPRGHPGLAPDGRAGPEKSYKEMELGKIR